MARPVEETAVFLAGCSGTQEGFHYTVPAKDKTQVFGQGKSRMKSRGDTDLLIV